MSAVRPSAGDLECALNALSEAVNDAEDRAKARLLHAADWRKYAAACKRVAAWLEQVAQEAGDDKVS